MSNLDNFFENLKTQVNEYVAISIRTALADMRTKSIDEIAKIVGVAPAFEPNDFAKTVAKPATKSTAKSVTTVKTAPVDYEKIVAFSTKNGKVTNGDVCRLFNVNPTRAWRELSTMVERKLLVKSGTNNATFYVTYRHGGQPVQTTTTTEPVKSKVSKRSATAETKKRVNAFLKSSKSSNWTTQDFANAIGTDIAVARGHLAFLAGKKRIRSVLVGGAILRDSYGNSYWRS